MTDITWEEYCSHRDNLCPYRNTLGVVVGSVVRVLTIADVELLFSEKKTTGDCLAKKKLQEIVLKPNRNPNTLVVCVYIFIISLVMYWFGYWVGQRTMAEYSVDTCNVIHSIEKTEKK